MALQEVRAAYADPLAAVQTNLRSMGLRPTPRLKTPTTIVEKLRRERTRLSTIQDIAGLRIVSDMTLAEQDELVERVIAEFPGARTQDRRLVPSYGYRAVHIIVEVSGLPVEIQIRTRLQDLWAQTMERLADRWGREIRYGALPKDDAQRDVVQRLIELSDTMAGAERERDHAATEVGEVAAWERSVIIESSQDVEGLHRLASVREDLEGRLEALQAEHRRLARLLETILDALS
ncbi:MAG: hypothetical protein ACRDKZ_11670 [Actinomycetota bacterium]